MSDLSSSSSKRTPSQTTRLVSSAGGDSSSKSSKPQDRPVNLRGDSSRSARSQSSHDTTEASTSTAPTNTQSLTPRTPYTPTITNPPPNPQFRIPASPRSVTMASNDSAKAAKVAIPRLKRSLDSGDAATKPGGRHRVTHACEPCRHRKTKCSGERPMCRHCQDFKIQCYYADGKRDRVKKQFGSMAEKVADYEKILRELQTRVSEDDANMIRSTLDRAAVLDGEDPPAEVTNNISFADVDPETEESGAESEASGGAGSTGALDRTDEDFTREGARATGFMGKNSEITWMQRLRHENKYGDAMVVDTDDPDDRRRTTGPSLQPKRRAETNLRQEAEAGFTVQDTSYHLNDLAISPFEAVDPYELPVEDHAHKLFNTYMTRVHPSFPVVGRINLQNQFAKFLARPSNRPPPKWLAIINLIFAIAAKYSHLIQADWQADERDHLIFFARARLLAVDAETIFNHPDLQSIQVLGLMSCYLLATEQINRAWMICGISLRSAVCLGLNMRNESTELPNGLKEIRYRVWWALYTLENRLCTMTGRVSCIIDEHCTTPLPVPIAEDDFESESGQKMLSSEQQRGVRAPSSNSISPPTTETSLSSRSVSKDEKGDSRSPSVPQSQTGELEWARDLTPSSSLYFLYLTHLCRITQEVFQQLYNPVAVSTKWSVIQVSMQHLNSRLEGWYRNLPPAFHFGRKQRDRDLYESRLTLGFNYYATRQIINRPCLCRLDQKIPGQSNKSNEFNRAAAVACVNAARDQLQLIPDEPNSVGLLRAGPWLTLLHMLVQTATVLMLEISFRGHHMPEHVDDILEDAKKAVRWLHALGDDNLAAARAWSLCHQMLLDCAKKIGRTVDSMPTHRPRSNRSASSEVRMMHSQGMFDNTGLQAQDQQIQGFSLSQNMPPTSAMDISNFGSFTAFDQMMHYDRSFQNAQDSLLDAQMAQGQGSINYAMPNDMDLNYMNPYLGQDPGQGGHRDDEGGGQGSMSGYG